VEVDLQRRQAEGLDLAAEGRAAGIDAPTPAKRDGRTRKGR
jgi:hypothetical protein